MVAEQLGIHTGKKKKKEASPYFTSYKKCTQNESYT